MHIWLQIIKFYELEKFKVDVYQKIIKGCDSFSHFNQINLSYNWNQCKIFSL